jgi:putative transposase
MNMDTRMGWIDSEAELSLVNQCELAGVSRATWYNRQTIKPGSNDDLQVCRLIDEEYTRRPFYGSRRMVLFLKGCGLTINRKRVQRLMATMGLAGMAPGPNTSKSIHSTRSIPTSCAV